MGARRSTCSGAIRRRATAAYHALARDQVDRAPHRGARSRTLRAAVRRDDRARRERAPSRSPPAGLLGSGRVALRVARPRGRGVCVPVLAPHRGAESLLPHAVVPHRAARVDRARAAPAAARQRSLRPESLPRCRARSRSSACSTSRRSRTRSGLQPWWYLGDGLAGLNSVAVVVVLISLALGAAFLWLPPRYAPVLPCHRRARLPRDLAAAPTLDTQLPAARDSAYHQGVGRATELDRRGRRPRRPCRAALDGRKPARGVGERVLEPQHRPRLPRGNAVARRHAVDAR